MNYEPEAEESLDLLIPKYINSIIYGAFIEAVASENGARMQAMDAATSNAEEMISTLSLAYNRAGVQSRGINRDYFRCGNYELTNIKGVNKWQNRIQVKSPRLSVQYSISDFDQGVLPEINDAVEIRRKMAPAGCRDSTASR